MNPRSGPPRPPAAPTRSRAAAEQHYQLAAALLERGRSAEAQAACQRALAEDPRHHAALHLIGIAALQAGQPHHAAGFFAKAADIAPANFSYHSNHGLALAAMGQAKAAVAAFDHAIALRSDVAEVHCSRADALHQLGDLDPALEGFERALALKADLAEAHGGRGGVLLAQGAPAAACEAFARALAIDPGYLEARYGLALARHESGAFDAGLVEIDRVIAAQPGLVEAHYARGNLLVELGRVEEAAVAYTKALELQPGQTDARKSLFRLRLGAGDIASAMTLSGEIAAEKSTAEIHRLAGTRKARAFRLRHDLEQATWLLEQGSIVPGLAEARVRLAEACARIPQTGAAIAEVELTEAECAVIGVLRERLSRPEPQAGDILNPSVDWAGHARAYLGAELPVIVIDDFLAPAALTALRRFCLEAGIWRTEYVNRYLGTFAEDGFLSAFHLRLAAEMRSHLPDVLAGHRLEQLWAFKYDPEVATGINVHADFARINLNFWITPDEANLDASSGGMVVYDVPAPAGWSFRAYNHDASAIQALLQEQGAKGRRILYRCNRAVLFDSRLFHETDEVRFKPGYENRRINVTYLFGRGLKTY